jgi:CheY-like chemotaxis protein
VGQILAFSRKGSNRDMRPVDVRTVIQESVGFLKTSLPDQVSLDVALPDSMPLVINGGDSQIQQVLLNLCANARDAMGDAGGCLTLRVYPRTVERGTIVSHGILRRGDYVCMEVSDTGHGMSADLQQRAFDPFFTTKGPGQGTGMGLALVYGIVQAHEGAIDLHSVPEQGTRFRVYLPAHTDTVAPDRRAPPVAEQGNGELVLAVEGDDSVRLILEGLLRRLGYTVECYRDPQSAVAAFAAAPRRYALVLTDRSMPEMDGLTLCRTVRRLDATVPLLLCSGYSEAVEADAQALLEPVAFLAKPYRAADLACALQRMIVRASARLGPVAAERAAPSLPARYGTDRSPG